MLLAVVTHFCLHVRRVISQYRSQIAVAVLTGMMIMIDSFTLYHTDHECFQAKHNAHKQAQQSNPHPPK